MKTRNGFVSNSSAASFVITWALTEKCIKENSLDVKNKEQLFDKAFCILFDVGETDDEHGNKPDLEIWHDLKDIYKELKEKTKLEDGVFTSIFNTCMLNSCYDLGNSAACFNLALDIYRFEHPLYKSDIDIISRELDRNYNY